MNSSGFLIWIQKSITWSNLGAPQIADPFAGRTKQLYGDGTVKPLVDEFNFVKVNVGGPDLVAHSRCPQFDALKSELKDRHKKLWDTSSSGTSRGLREGKELDDLVPTLYIYEHEEGAMKKAARQHLYSVPLSSASTYNEHFNEIEMAWLTKLNADDFIALEKEGKWKCWEDCAAWLTSHSVTTDRYLVPNLEAIGGLEEFRFKSITAEELECLEGWENPFCHGDYTYVLGVEPRALTNELCFGVLLAMSGFDPLLTKTTMTYYGASMMAECIRRGFKRTTIGHYGMNGYNNERTR
ncbi:expressed unknown protein [Seminavis robusta]|uniref:Uncharacterized protein n=1 Tax=Seminavis robusta TaxID=568900 RepID=A0A9N8EXF9_9STRA|nr:expressed unknown protein [Seminavis robusta]|eukprot:Sro1979_g309110.1 n/a (296) ;mRNA; r:18168-19147